jgi:hypothetical protein
MEIVFAIPMVWPMRRNARRSCSCRRRDASVLLLLASCPVSSVAMLTDFVRMRRPRRLQEISLGIKALHVAVKDFCPIGLGYFALKFAKPCILPPDDASSFYPVSPVK